MTRLDKDIFRVVGLMSGTSMDGIDVAMVETDGRDHIKGQAFVTVPYSEDLRARLRATLGTMGEMPMAQDVATELTVLHADAVGHLMRREGVASGGVDLIGFHGHTIFHHPARRITRQIGDGAHLARLTGVPVVNDFRTADVEAGGQGAPLVPLFHRALAQGLERPLAVLNIGGVANITYIGSGDPIAFDTGPGNALIDDLFLEATGTPLDRDGETALKGRVHWECVERFLENPYFTVDPPKSLDRDYFESAIVQGLSLPDAAATLTACTVASIAKARDFLPEEPRRWLVAGGGRHNRAIMKALAEALGVPVDAVEAVGWDGDALEAQAFAYLAVRSLKELPLTVPSTTGVSHPLTGGTLHTP